jgi:hypothetical protein
VLRGLSARVVRAKIMLRGFSRGRILGFGWLVLRGFGLVFFGVLGCFRLSTDAHGFCLEGFCCDWYGLAANLHGLN